MQIPNRNVFANADCSSTGTIPLNCTWGFVQGATIYVYATGMSSLECEIVDVTSSTIKVKQKGSYTLTDLSGYTLAKAAGVNQPAQELTSSAFLSQIDPASKVTLQLLNSPAVLIGTITSTGTAQNNHTTVVPFFDVNQAMKELIVTVQPSIACNIKVTTDNATLATSSDESLQAGEKRTICLGGTQGWISVIGANAAAVDLRVYRNIPL